MLIWLLIFALIAGISFLLALRSMKNYREKPSYFTTAYSLYLLQKPQNLTLDLLNRIGEMSLQGKLMLSFERLFKGDRSALVVFGPLHVLGQFKEELGLLELEEYSGKVQGGFKVWEFGLKPKLSLDLSNFQFKKEDLRLTDNEQVWCQVVTRFNAESGFRLILRVVTQSLDSHRLNQLQHQINQLFGTANLVPLPKPLNSHKLLKHYQERAFSGWLVGGHESLNLDSHHLRKFLALD